MKNEIFGPLVYPKALLSPSMSITSCKMKMSPSGGCGDQIQKK